jgi:hypothetical protein
MLNRVLCATRPWKTMLFARGLAGREVGRFEAEFGDGAAGRKHVVV